MCPGSAAGGSDTSSGEGRVGEENKLTEYQLNLCEYEERYDACLAWQIPW